MTNTLLFVSRAFPPILGGIENQNRGLVTALSARVPTVSIINRHGKRALPLFLPWALMRMLWCARRHDVVLLGDGVLAPLGAIVKLLSPRVRVFAVVHGLDVTYASRPGLISRGYRLLNIPSLRRLDGLIAVGRETVEAAVRAGVSRTSIHFIPNGIFAAEYNHEPAREELEDLLGETLAERRIVLCVGRFVARKGVEWFIRNVLPSLPKSVLFIAAGAAPAPTAFGDAGYLATCRRAAVETHQAARVRFLVNLPTQELKIFLASADLVVMPNIAIAGTIEGFGLTAIEAGAMGRIVLAADIEGLRDAIQDGQNGVLLPSEEPESWIHTITEWLDDEPRRAFFGSAARAYVRAHFEWENIAERYLDVLYSPDLGQRVNSNHGSLG
ncbi:MAG: glycosyltransferase family 4 protein [Gammaproteobacteria bacterium]|nr:glycosyltransferase family 4 protein [Gammaproteobacteria bacterium]